MSRYDQPPQGWFRRCGRYGMKLPAISLGCWHNFGAPGTGSAGGSEEATFHENCRRMLFEAFERGITHFDLANNYGPPPGSAEERVGRILKELPRDELIIATKAGYRMWDGPYGDGGSRKYLLASLDQSLRRLGLDYVDIFYHHRPDSETPLEETLGALDQAVRSGKALYAGISNYSGAQTADMLLTGERNDLVSPVIHQPSYSMLNRRPESHLFPVTERFGLGVIVFSPLQQGLLTGKYLEGVPDDSRAASASGFLRRENITPALVEKLRRLNEVAQARGQTLAQMALAWVLRPGAATSALIGASRPEQIEENVRAAQSAPFGDEELRRIDAILSG
jgi:L-glyceraldehyde 3-phosphate reductase